LLPHLSMTQDASRSLDSSPCLIRPAQAGDRKALEQLVRKFHQSLQLGHRWWLRPSHQMLIAIAWVTLLAVLVLYGFYSHAFALGIMLALVLQAHQQTDKTLAPFWVAERSGKVIGCAKLFCYNTHAEAYLVYIDPAWRGQGCGSHLVKRLTEEATSPLYLASQSHRLQFYMRLGFVPLPPDALPVVVRSRLGIDRYHEYGIVGMVFGRSKTENGG